ncbi:ankyrin [Thozetella sp. PMI_491]|nr:ankyrin [Thozetella sp. PMI_491]
MTQGNPDKVRSFTSCLLHVAVGSGSTDVAKVLLRNGADVNEPATSDFTAAIEDALLCDQGLVAVHISAVIGSTLGYHSSSLAFSIPEVQYIQKLLPAEFLRDPAKIPRHEDRCYLETAILTESQDVVEFAFSLDRIGYSSGALCAAVFSAIQSNLDAENFVLQELLRRRDKADLLTMNPTLENTALSMAAWSSRGDLVARLLEGQPSSLPNHPAVVPRRCPRKVCKNPNPENILTIWGWRYRELKESVARKLKDWHTSSYTPISPLIFAVDAGDEAIIEMLLEAGYRADGFTLRLAILRKTPLRLLGGLIITLLLDRGAKVDQQSTHKRFRYSTDLQIAAQAGMIGVAQVLLARGADINAPRRFWAGKTALEGAAINGRLDMVQLLLSSGAETEGDRRVQYVNAVLEANKRGHGAVVQQWSDYVTEANLYSRVDAVKEAICIASQTIIEYALKHDNVSREAMDIASVALASWAAGLTRQHQAGGAMDASIADFPHSSFLNDAETIRNSFFTMDFPDWEPLGPAQSLTCAGCQHFDSDIVDEGSSGWSRLYDHEVGLDETRGPVLGPKLVDDDGDEGEVELEKRRAFREDMAGVREAPFIPVSFECTICNGLRLVGGLVASRPLLIGAGACTLELGIIFLLLAGIRITALVTLRKSQKRGLRGYSQFQA